MTAEMAKQLVKYIKSHPNKNFLIDYHPTGICYMLFASTYSNGVDPCPPISDTRDVIEIWDNTIDWD